MKTSLLPLTLVMLLATGCTARGFGAAMVTTGALIDVVAVTENARLTTGDESEERAKEIRAEQDLWSRPDVYLVPEASAKDTAAPPKRASFDPVRTRNNLGNVDLKACSAEHGAGVTGHATVTYAPSGAVTRVVVDGPANLTTPLVACVGAALGRSTVPAFDGSPIPVGTTWRVP